MCSVSIWSYPVGFLAEDDHEVEKSPHRLQAKLMAASNYLLYDKSIKQMLEGEPEDIWVGEDWA